MQKLFIYCFKAGRKIFRACKFFYDQVVCLVLFYGQGVHYKSFKSHGLPFVSVAKGGKFEIGSGLELNNTISSNPIGRSQPCIFFINSDAVLVIGDRVGISQAAIVCHQNITIGNDVKIGGGVCIYDTDFHSLHPEVRKNSELDFKYKTNSPVIIKDNAFIGAHSTILKGVTIGKNAVIGSCSLVAKDVPDNEIWAGNPARKIKSLFDVTTPHSKIETL